MNTRIIYLTIAALTSAACTSVGPSMMKTIHQPYNEALATSQEQEIFLNLLRIAESKKPYFLTIDSVTTSYQFRANASLGATLTKAILNNDSEASNSATGDSNTRARSVTNTDGFTAGVGGSWQETPTVIYKPLTGEDFSKRLLSPISLENLALLYGAGYNAELIIRLFVSRAGDFYGGNQELWDLSKNLGILQRKGYLEILPVAGKVAKDGKEGPPRIFISWRTDDGKVAKEVCEFVCMMPGWGRHCTGGYKAYCQNCRSLEMPKEEESYQKWLTEDEPRETSRRYLPIDRSGEIKIEAPTCPTKPSTSQPSPDPDGGMAGESERPPPDAPLIGTRSLVGALRRALGVQARSSEIDLVGDCSSTAKKFGDYISIYCKREKPNPSDAFLGVKYRNNWYWISNEDVTSQQAYFMFSLLYTMQAGDPQAGTSAEVVIPVR